MLAIVANSRFGDRVEWLTKHAAALAWGGVSVIVLCFAYRNPLFRDTVRYRPSSLLVCAILVLTVGYAQALRTLLNFRSSGYAAGGCDEWR